MTGMRGAWPLLGVAGVLAGGVWLFAAQGGHDPAPAPRPTDVTWPLAAVAASPTAPVSSSAPAASSSPPAAEPAAAAPSLAARGAAAEPFVQSFAEQPGVPAQRPLPSPTSTHYVRPNVDGCDHNYGAITQCVPWTFPAGTADKCAWLAGHGFEQLRVVGTDRQKLDRDGNGIACA